ncbi:hypothetical protein NGF19_03755 [Streptomyces sp. RY43-2]|uniref:Uncharacterized protein n=1 Tax=Streptomyces macrolidinus TaxID=2952607 RepID=A0ABT0Z9N8_9ACTN|nr:hypothetical protein [Streptomyces macrolidinus]MCN9239909.1 hypothetical protein [Streptomyces macrolidinus]
MITTTRVGDWTWELATDSGEIRPARAVQTSVTVWDELAKRNLAAPEGKARILVRSGAKLRDVRFDASGLHLGPDPLAPGSDLAQAMAEAEALEGDFVLTIRIECPGYWLESGVRHRAEKLFSIQVEVWDGNQLVVTLETYSDAWLTMDTRDREQPEVYAENAPRLAAALDSISAVLGASPTPGDENCYAAPSSTGFKDLRSEGPAYVDSWGTFEGLNRASLLSGRIPPCEDEYESYTEHPVRYFTVQREGRTLGFVWASVDDAAAGYVPRTAVGDEAFEVGAGWLLCLRQAYSQGLSPLAALNWLAQGPSHPELGLITEGSPREAESLDALEELSGRY